MKDDHPSNAPHQECKVDHGGRGVKPHCRCGAAWPCHRMEYERTHSLEGYPLGSPQYPDNREGRRALARTWKRQRA